MAQEEPPTMQVCEASLATIEEAYERAVNDIGADADTSRALEHASRLTTRLREMSEDVAAIRAPLVEKIWREEELSLMALADRVGVSKSRAKQILDSVQATKEKNDG